MTNASKHLIAINLKSILKLNPQTNKIVDIKHKISNQITGSKDLASDMIHLDFS